jgi:FtsP/CotA-like multicopper oxidase with cupredoxin domain
MSEGSSALAVTRRGLLGGGAALVGLAVLSPVRLLAAAGTPLVTVVSRTIEVNGKPAKVFAVNGPGGKPGVSFREGDRFAGALLNQTELPLQMHWHGQVKAPFDQDRARPGGGMLAAGQSDAHDFELTPGTHWMHSHTLTEQQLLAAPMVTRERDAGDVQDVVIMLHDFAFRSPEEILAELGGSDVHASHGASPPVPSAGSAAGSQAGSGSRARSGSGSATGSKAGSGNGSGSASGSGSSSGSRSGSASGSASGSGSHSGSGSGSGSGSASGSGSRASSGSAKQAGSASGSAAGSTAHGGSGHQPGVVHANDVRYDAYLANDRTLSDPEVVTVEKSGRVRLRIINGATASAFFISTPMLTARCIAVDGSACSPVAAASFPLAQGQRIDLLVEIPKAGGAFPVLAQVEGERHVTGIYLATAGANISKVAPTARVARGLVGLELETRLTARTPLAARKPDKTFRIDLGEQPGYRWTLNGRVHGEHQPLEARQGERIEITFHNPTSMMHPMHLHGHHFQVVAIAGRRFSGAMRDTVIVPPHRLVTVALDANLKGDWFLHCHHLYHMATGMMTELKVS